MLGLAMKSIYSQRPMLELIEEMDGSDDEPTEEFLHTELWESVDRSWWQWNGKVDLYVYCEIIYVQLFQSSQRILT